MPVQTTQPLPFYADPFELVFILLGVAAVIAGLIFYFRKPKLFDSPEAMGRHTVQNWDYNKSAEHMKVQTEKIAAANLMQNEVTISINAEAAIKLAEYNRQHILEETRIARELLMSEQVKNISQNNFDATRLRMMSSLLREAEQMGVTLEDLSAVRRKELENQVENRHDTEKQLLKLKILLLAKGIKDGSIREVDIGRELRGLHEGSDRGAGV